MSKETPKPTVLDYGKHIAKSIKDKLDAISSAKEAIKINDYVVKLIVCGSGKIKDFLAPMDERIDVVDPKTKKVKKGEFAYRDYFWGLDKDCMIHQIVLPENTFEELNKAFQAYMEVSEQDSEADVVKAIVHDFNGKVSIREKQPYRASDIKPEAVTKSAAEIISEGKKNNLPADEIARRVQALLVESGFAVS